MKCKTCGHEYTEFDGLHIERNRLGWHPSFGDCFLCFSYASYGPMMGPWYDKKYDEFQGYQITPAGKPSTFKFQKEFDSFLDDCDKESERIDIEWQKYCEREGRAIDGSVDVPF